MTETMAYQLRNIMRRWVDLSIVQKTIILSALSGFTISGMLILLVITSISLSTPFKHNGYANIKVWVDTDKNVHLWFMPNKKRDCRVATSVFIWRQAETFSTPTRQQILIASFNTEISTVDNKQATEEIIPLPAYIKDLEGWHYQAITNNDCDWFSAIAPSAVLESADYPLHVSSEPLLNATDGVKQK